MIMYVVIDHYESLFAPFSRTVVSSHGVKIHYYNYLIMPLMQCTMVKKFSSVMTRAACQSIKLYVIMMI